VPVWLSKISPITINAITLGPLVFSRGEISDTTRQHETIHWQQYIETGVVGFAVLYPLFWIINRFKKLNGRNAYYAIPFELEAYENQEVSNYLEKRKRFYWVKFIGANPL
tara:strand:+ start:397 stop:726 length:330 start_codon:yes stop_codon:yes gene_type:complete